jgi:hypothetical protein
MIANIIAIRMRVIGEIVIDSSVMATCCLHR